MPVPFPSEALASKRGKHMTSTFIEWLVEELVASRYGGDAPSWYFRELDERLAGELSDFFGGLELPELREFEDEELHERSDQDYQKASGL